MIVRLMGEGQYELDKAQVDELNRIDNNLVNVVDNGDEDRFKTEFKKIIDYVHSKGKHIPDDVIKPSDIIIPPADITLEEAKSIFKGEGLIKN